MQKLIQQGPNNQAKAKYWLCTLNNPVILDIAPLYEEKKDAIKHISGQAEIGEQGTPHL